MQSKKSLNEIPDDELLIETEKLVLDERRLLLGILEHLREIQRRKLFVEIGYTSLHDYAVRHLKYSDDQAARRISAMRLLTAIPSLSDKVENGSLSLTVMAMASRFFKEEEKSVTVTEERKLAILEEISDLPTREVERKLIANSSDPQAYRARAVESIRPVSATENEVRVVLTDEVLEKINILRGRLAHKRPGMSISELISTLCDFALDEWNPAREPKRKLAQRNGGKPDRRPEMKRAPSAEVKRIVYGESGNRCQNCGSVYFLEIDHIKPWSHGGKTTVENLRVLCRNCNQRRHFTNGP